MLHKGQAILIAFILVFLVVVLAILPFILLESTTASFHLQSGSSSSIIETQKELQIEDIEYGNPSIQVYQNNQGHDYIKFSYIHGNTPLDIQYIFYYNTTLNKWMLAYPGSYVVLTNTTLYLYTPLYYNGEIEIITNLNNIIYLPVQSTVGLITYTNIYNITEGNPYLIFPNGTSIQLPQGTLLITNTSNILPKIATNENITIPEGTTIMTSSGEITLKENATLELKNAVLEQKCIESGYFPISSFLTGYQSDNDNIGTIPLEQRNPELQTQTLVQWFIASSQMEPIVIDTSSPTTPEANISYYSKYAPQGGYVLWSGNAGIITGYGIEIGNNQPAPPPQSNDNGQFYVGFTVQLNNGTWVTILDPKPFPAIGNENGQSSSALTLAIGTYNVETGTMSLYVNGSLVSEVTLQKNLPLNDSISSFMDVGSVYNGSGPTATQQGLLWIPGFSGDINDGGLQQYSFDGALGPSFVYNISLTSAQISEIYSGNIPSPENIVVLWSQNSAQEVYLNTESGSTSPAYYSQQPNPSPGKLSTEAVEVYNLADLSKLNGFWGWGGAIPTAFAPFNDIVIWGGPSPVLFNPTLVLNKPINITFESTGALIPEKPGEYVFSANFTDSVPIAENNKAPNGYANEWVTVYINGQEVFAGKYINNKLYVTYSDNSYFNENNLPEFQYYLNRPANITTVFTFNLDVNANNGGPTQPSIPAVYFSIMWMPPGSEWFQYIPITNIQPIEP